LYFVDYSNLVWVEKLDGIKKAAFAGRLFL